MSAITHDGEVAQQPTVQAIVDRYAGLISDRHIFFRPAIPANNLSRAVEKYAQGVSPDDVLVLADDAMRWIGGTTGVLFTDTCLYEKESLSQPVSIPLATIGSVSLSEKLTGTSLVVNGETFHVCRGSPNESLRLFARMLQEIVAIATADPQAAALMKGRAMPMRLIPIRGGRPSRFTFTNLWLDARTPREATFISVMASPLGNAEAQFEATEGRMTLRPTKGQVAVNGVVVHDPRPLAHGDLIALRHWNVEARYEFEDDPRLAKQARWQREAALGIRRSPPDMTSFETGETIADEMGITVTENGRSTTFSWEQLDAVQFEPRPQYVQTSGDLFTEMKAGAAAGSKISELIAEDVAESDIDPVFHASVYNVRLLRHGKVVEHFAIEAARCVLLAQAIEYYAPIDLTWFGESPPEPTSGQPADSEHAEAVGITHDERVAQQQVHETTVQSIVDRYAGLIGDRDIFFRPAIPANKLSSAVEKYAQGVSPDDVLVLAGDTSRLLGGAYGVLFTDTCLYERWPTVKSIPLAWIESVSCKKATLVVNGETFHDCHGSKEESVRLLARMLQEIVALPSPEPGHE